MGVEQKEKELNVSEMTTNGLTMEQARLGEVIKQATDEEVISSSVARIKLIVREIVRRAKGASKPTGRGARGKSDMDKFLSGLK